MTDKDRTAVIIGTGASVMRAVGGDGQAEIIDPIADAPVIQGPHGKAWLCNCAAGYAKLGVRPEDDACLAHWIIEAPWAHPAWHSFSLVLVHLRPMPGKKTLIYLDCATHEMWLYAMDPTTDRRPLLATGIVEKNWLSPMNFAAQFVEVTDELAVERIGNAVQAICDGNLSPDTDFRQHWIALFGDNMQKDRPSRRPAKVQE